MFTNWTYFPLTRYCYRNGKNRCDEPIDPYEKNQCFGPPDRDCIDCYYPITPICFIIDVVSCNLFQCQFFKEPIEDNQN